MSVKAEIIGFDSGWGCGDYGCQDGPEAFRTGISIGAKALGDRAQYKTKHDTLPFTVQALQKLYDRVRAAQNLPVVIGGDHSSAIGTWSAVTQGMEQQFGLIWVDAHMDSHTFETSNEGKWGGWWHGQPLAALCGHGLPELRDFGGLQPKLSPQHISLIGIHSFEPSEKKFAEKNGIRVYFLDEVEERGFQACFSEALERATTGTKAFGLTLDMDCFHPAEAPGVGSMEKKGLHAAEVLPVLKNLARHPLFKALEIAEFNPHNDKNNKTLHLLGQVMESVLA